MAVSYIPDARLLGGLSLDVAECYGKPCVGAFYEHSSAKSNRLVEGAMCMCCGKPATNSHHCPPLSKGRIFSLRTPFGMFILKPSLFALCGSGTTGCHNDFHGGARYKARWQWINDGYAEMWWDGHLLSHGIEPHSPELYSMGHWVIEDKLTSTTFEVRHGN